MADWKNVDELPRLGSRCDFRTENEVLHHILCQNLFF